MARQTTRKGEPAKQVAIDVLREAGEPLHAKEIAKRVIDSGRTRAQDGRRLLLQRASGFDLHSVRDYVHGDSLRKVHWRSTARRAPQDA